MMVLLTLISRNGAFKLQPAVASLSPPTRSLASQTPIPTMAEVKHLVLVKFKEGTVVEDILKGLTELVSSTGHVIKSFEWGQDVETPEMLTQGFTHAFVLTFRNVKDLDAYISHPSHIEFGSTFSAAVEKVLTFDFPIQLVKTPA